MKRRASSQAREEFCKGKPDGEGEKKSTTLNKHRAKKKRRQETTLMHQVHEGYPDISFVDLAWRTRPISIHPYTHAKQGQQDSSRLRPSHDRTAALPNQKTTHAPCLHHVHRPCQGQQHRHLRKTRFSHRTQRFKLICKLDHIRDADPLCTQGHRDVFMDLCRPQRTG